MSRVSPFFSLPTLAGADVGLPGGRVDVSSGESGVAPASPAYDQKRPPETASASLSGRGVSGALVASGAVSGGRSDKRSEGSLK